MYAIACTKITFFYIYIRIIDIICSIYYSIYYMIIIIISNCVLFIIALHRLHTIFNNHNKVRSTWLNCAWIEEIIDKINCSCFPIVFFRTYLFHFNFDFGVNFIFMFVIHDLQHYNIHIHIVAFCSFHSCIHY